MFYVLHIFAYLNPYNPFVRPVITHKRYETETEAG